jgi:RNA recognition motif-containing protein
LQVPIFEQVGPIYELRLMLDFSQSNRGYFFVRYTCKEDAKKAVKMLNKFEIRPKKFIGVVLSVDNRKLWVNGLPKGRSAAEVKVGLTMMSSSTFVGSILLESPQS